MKITPKMLMRILKSSAPATNVELYTLETELNSMILLLRFLRIARTALGLAQWTDWCIAMNLLVTRETALHRRRLLSANER
jgi:hypothetical protein